MPIGMSIIMKKIQSVLKSARKLSQRVDDYFNHIKGERSDITEIAATKKANIVKQREWIREPEPATITGLAFFLGFKSRQAFDEYEHTGRFAHVLKRARLQIETIYEKKLHQPSPYGAIFALKSLGWNEKLENETAGYKVIPNVRVEIVESGPRLAESEKDVVL
ncbi:MAG: hypothetical protein JWR02_1492 [Mucilaginibacter sp.]|nr:hypothetical protein [Mucilaginibacter sp.]